MSTGMIKLTSHSRGEPIWLRSDQITTITGAYYQWRDGTSVRTAAGDWYEVRESPDEIQNLMEGKCTRS